MTDSAYEMLDEDIKVDLERLDTFGKSLARKRSEAIAARQASGIEDIWREDEEFYEGIDDLNRSEEARLNWHQKPPGQTAGPQNKATRSSVFPNITAPFVDAAVARLADIILPPISVPAWDMKPTPIPDLVRMANAEFPELPNIDYDNPAAIRKQAEMENAQRDEAKRQIQEAERTAERAKDTIHDWHLECNRNAEAREVLEDAGKVGVGILKGPVTKVKTRWGFIDGAVTKIVKKNPVSRRIDYWNFYPDKDCGEDVQNGEGTWERDYISRSQLRRFLEDDSYVKDQVMRCLEEGPQRATAEFADTPEPVTDPMMVDKFEIWYFYGTAEREDLEAGGCDCSDMEDPHVPAMLTMCNNHVIRASLNALDSGHFPYSVFTWRKRRGHWAGIGVSRQIRVAQKVVTGGTRNLMDNAGLGAGPMLVFRQGVVNPADSVAKFEPRKIWYIAEDADSMVDATKAIGQVKVDMLVDELLKIIQFGMKLAEDTTGLPMLLQGQMGAAPDTVGGMKLLYNNTAAPLRRLARMFDNQVTETELERYYVWLLLYGPDDAKGDFFLEASGSQTLVERDLQEQELGQMASIVLDLRYKVDPAKWMEEWLKSRRFDPENFQYDEDSEEWQQIVQSVTQPPPDSALQIAELRAQVDQLKIQAGAEVTLTEAQMRAELEVWKEQQRGVENDMDRQLKMILAGAEEEMAQAKTATERANIQDKMQADMAALVMKIRSQERLAGMKAVSDRLPIKKQPAEPPGRAEAGMSIQE